MQRPGHTPPQCAFGDASVVVKMNGTRQLLNRTLRSAVQQGRQLVMHTFGRCATPEHPTWS
jgi:hypothetical protein